MKTKYTDLLNDYNKSQPKKKKASKLSDQYGKDVGIIKQSKINNEHSTNNKVHKKT